MCSLFCCFGCLTVCGCRDRITRRLVFFPPPPTYCIEEGKDGGAQTMWLLTEAGHKVEPYSSPDFKFLYLPTRRRNLIACMWLSCAGSSECVIFSHGNATDLGCMREHLLALSAQLRVNVMAYDYSGYGLSSGSPSASNCQADVEAVYWHVRQHHPLACRRIVLYGQSLGSGPSLHLASLQAVSGVVVHSGLLSCLRVLDPSLPRTPFYDLFPNIDLAPALLHSPPVLVIHGAADSEITPVHAERLYDGVVCKYGLWLASGCGHNDVEVKARAEYWQRLSDFVQWVKANVEELQLVEAEAAKRREQERQRKARERSHWWR